MPSIYSFMNIAKIKCEPQIKIHRAMAAIAKLLLLEIPQFLRQSLLDGKTIVSNSSRLNLAKLSQIGRQKGQNLAIWCC